MSATHAFSIYAHKLRMWIAYSALRKVHPPPISKRFALYRILLYIGTSQVSPYASDNNRGTLNIMTSSNGNIFRVTGPLCGEFTDPGEFPTQRPVTRSSDVFFDLRLNKRLSKQPWGWWFETPSWSLWRQCNEIRLNKLLHHKLKIFPFKPKPDKTMCLLSGVPDLWDRNKILIYMCLTVYEFSFILFDLCLFITIFNFILNYVPIVTSWIFTYYKIRTMLIIYCFIWNYWFFLFCNMFGCVLECYELTSLSLLWPWLVKGK